MTENPEATKPDAREAEYAGRQEASDKLGEATVVAAPEADEYRTYVAAAKYANNKFLAKAGMPVKAPVVAGATSGIVPLITRDGDVWVKFANAVLTTKDPDIIAWCEAHKSVCRDASDPRTPGWATLQEFQTVKSTRDASLDGSIDVDALAFPDLSNFEGALAASASGEAGQSKVAEALNDAEKVKATDSERAEHPERLRP